MIDICGECLEPTDPNFGQSCIDCNGVVEGTSVIDICGECLDPSDPTFNQSCIDCSGVLNGTFLIDECGNCLDSNDPEFSLDWIIDKSIYIPNVIFFNDGVNGLFEIFPGTKSDVVSLLKYRIYDRWGNPLYVRDMQVFSEFDEWWEGFNSNGALIQGVYTYVIELVYKNDESCLFHGTVTLLL